MSEVLLFMGGYILALRHVNRENVLLREWWFFLDWLQRRLQLDPVASWHSQLIIVLGDSRESVVKLLALYREFSSTYETAQIEDGALKQ